MTAAVSFTLSGKTYYACVDPGCSQVAAEIGLPVPTHRRVGRGDQFVWTDVPTDTALALHDHLVCVGEGFAYGDDPDTRAEGRAIIRDAAKLGKAIR